MFKNSLVQELTEIKGVLCQINLALLYSTIFGFICYFLLKIRQAYTENSEYNTFTKEMVNTDIICHARFLMLPWTPLISLLQGIFCNIRINFPS